MNTRNVQWLYGELPDLVAAGVLSQESAERIRSHYGPVKSISAARAAILLFSILGGLLIGAGVILLLAYNWSDLGRPIRAVLSFVPLATGQMLVGWTLWRRTESAAWREGSSAFLAMSIGASIALIGQTYHIPGNLANFLFTWLLLGLPLLYLLRSATVAVFYLAGATAWAVAAQEDGGHALWYWPLLAALLPFLFAQHREAYGKAGTLLVHWCVCISLCIGIGVALEKVLPGLWILAYTAYFALLSLSGRRWYRDIAGQPLSLIGGFGTVILGIILTFSDWWWRIGFRHYRGGNSRYTEWAGVQDYLLVLLLVGAVVALAVHLFGKRDWRPLVWAGSPLIALVSYAFATADGMEWVPPLLFNGYLFVLGVLVLKDGVQESRLAVANGGMGILALLFTVRFFDSDMGILMRGIAFILIGAGFLCANVFLARKLGKSPEEAAS